MSRSSRPRYRIVVGSPTCHHPPPVRSGAPASSATERERRYLVGGGGAMERRKTERHRRAPAQRRPRTHCTAREAALPPDGRGRRGSRTPAVPSSPSSGMKRPLHRRPKRRMPDLRAVQTTPRPTSTCRAASSHAVWQFLWRQEALADPKRREFIEGLRPAGRGRLDAAASRRGDLDTVQRRPPSPRRAGRRRTGRLGDAWRQARFVDRPPAPSPGEVNEGDQTARVHDDDGGRPA